MTTDQIKLLLEQVYNLFKGQPASLVGSAVSASLYNINTFNDIDVFFDSVEALHYGVATAEAGGYELDNYSKRKLGFSHRWGGKRFHVETYRLTKGDVELNLSHKLLGGVPVRGTAQVLMSFDFGFLLAGYDCQADTFEDAFLDLRPAYFPKEHAVGGPYPMVLDKGREFVRGNFGTNNALRSAERIAKYALRGYDVSAIKPQMMAGYRAAAEDLLQIGSDEKELLAEIYMTILDHIKFAEWDEIIEACSQLGFNEPVARLQEVFD